MAEFILKDWYGKNQTFDNETIYVRDKDGNLMPFTFGTGTSDDVRYVTFMSYDGLIEYGKKAVAVGDDCADPIARGVFSTPTRESDAQYNYTFYGWATAPNGGADANALKAVTEDKTVYANFTQAVRSYTITYYDDDGTTVLKTQILSYGSMPNYEPSKEGFSFDCWTPSLTMVTGATSYTAVWTENLVFANATWADIARVAESGKASQMFAIGDTRKIPITFSNNRTYEVEFMIVDFGKDTLADGSGTAGMTIVSVPAIALSSSDLSRSLVNTADASALTLSSTQKYSDSAIRTVVNTQLYGMLPSELRNVIKSVTKSSYHYSFSTTESTEKLWMLGRNEVNYTSTLTAGRYQYFSSNANRQKTGIYSSSATAVSAYSSTVPYMLRDGSGSNKNFHYYVGTNGAISYSGAYGQHTATSSYYAPVGFCI